MVKEVDGEVYSGVSDKHHMAPGCVALLSKREAVPFVCQNTRVCNVKQQLLSQEVEDRNRLSLSELHHYYIFFFSLTSRNQQKKKKESRFICDYKLGGIVNNTHMKPLFASLYECVCLPPSVPSFLFVLIFGV